MASTTSRPSAPAPAPSTPINPTTTRAPAQQQLSNPQTPQDGNNATPNTESRMNPPSIPRSLMTPSRETRESSVQSNSGSGMRKPRQNVDEKDHKLMVQLCINNCENYKEGTKSQFWHRVNADFLTQSGKVLAQLSATVGRLVEARRRQIVDWEHGVIPEKPGGELNALLDEWIGFLKSDDGDGEAERMRQVDAKRRAEESRKEARRKALAAEQLANTAGSMGVRIAQAGGPPPTQPLPLQTQLEHTEVQRQLQALPQPQPQTQILPHPNGIPAPEVSRPSKRRRHNDVPLQSLQPEAVMHRGFEPQSPLSPTRRVVVENALTKDDWRDIMGNDARLRALEGKVDKIELLVAQNNKLLLQLVGSGHGKGSEEERVPVHLDAEFERDYL